MKNKKINILIWLPASWKSTYIENHSNKNSVIISSDKIRFDIFWDENIQKNNNLVFEKFFSSLVESIKKWDEEIFLDATNISLKDRKKIFNIIKQSDKPVLKIWAKEELQELSKTEKIDFSNREMKKKYFQTEYNIIWIFFDSDIQTTIDRDLSRNRTVWEKVILRMLTRLIKPELEEWFDEIKIVSEENEKQEKSRNGKGLKPSVDKEVWKKELVKFVSWENNLESVLKNDIFLEKSINCEQKSQWHQETLLEHLEMILKLVNEKSEKKDLKILRLITLFHDIWKPFTKDTKTNNLIRRWYTHIWKTNFKKKNWEDVIIENYEDFQFLWHEIFSANMFSLSYKKLLINSKIITKQEGELIENIIKAHLDFHDNLWNNSIKISWKTYNEKTEIFRLWTLFSWCDGKGRIKR